MLISKSFLFSALVILGLVMATTGQAEQNLPSISVPDLYKEIDDGFSAYYNDSAEYKFWLIHNPYTGRWAAGDHIAVGYLAYQTLDSQLTSSIIAEFYNAFSDIQL